MGERLFRFGATAAAGIVSGLGVAALPNSEWTKLSPVMPNIHEAKTHFSRLVQRAAAGEEIVITKAGVPMAKLVPFRQSRAPRRPGFWKGKMRIASDFDALPDEIVASFEGSE